jgi:phosphoserine phosphatase
MNSDQFHLTLQGADISSSLLKFAFECLSTKGAAIIRLPSTTQGDAFRINAAKQDTTALAEVVRACDEAQVDCVLTPQTWTLAQFKLAAFDMDSTLISIECIDEIADFAGVKKEVSAITESAMRGEIEYPESLKRRVALLDGLPESALEAVYHERLRLNPGCEALMHGLKQAGIELMVVSGGFTFFTSRIQARLGLQHAHSNVLEVIDGKLTGKLASDIFDGEAKRRELTKLAQLRRLNRTQLIAVGDGANDLPMMSECDLSVAYHAKPKVQDKAAVRFNHVGLDGLLAVLQPSA